MACIIVPLDGAPLRLFLPDRLGFGVTFAMVSSTVGVDCPLATPLTHRPWIPWGPASVVVRVRLSPGP